MKKAFKSYISFTRTERIGIIALCIVLLILIAVRTTMPLWVHPKTDPEKEQRLAAAWAAFEQANLPDANNTPGTAAKEHQDGNDENTTPIADTIDINTADSALLVRLKGVGPVTAGKIVSWRKKHGRFTNIEQLKETGGFAPDIFDLLKKHLVIYPSQR